MEVLLVIKQMPQHLDLVGRVQRRIQETKNESVDKTITPRTWEKTYIFSNATKKEER
jgi:hypothetical protein